MTDYADTLVFLDIETTGLDPDNGVILELGFLVVDANSFMKLESESWIVGQPFRILEGMEGWPKKQHRESGLTDLCERSNQSVLDVEMLARDWLENINVGDGKVPMCGASIHFDRAWLKVHMPTVEEWFYYGNLDVSSIEKVARIWYPELPAWEDRGQHRVDPDNEDAVRELSYYQTHIFKSSI